MLASQSLYLNSWCYAALSTETYSPHSAGTGPSKDLNQQNVQTVGDVPTHTRSQQQQPPCSPPSFHLYLQQLLPLPGFWNSNRPNNTRNTVQQHTHALLLPCHVATPSSRPSKACNTSLGADDRDAHHRLSNSRTNQHTQPASNIPRFLLTCSSCCALPCRDALQQTTMNA